MSAIRVAAAAAAAHERRPDLYGHAPEEIR